MNSRESCANCLLPVNCYPVHLDDQGVCSYCRTTEQFHDHISRIGSQQDMLAERLQLFRNEGQYDCILGFSGGKDSSYVLYRLKKHYNARVLAFTCDNGFLTTYAKDNIRRLVETMKVDHIWVSPPAEILRELYRNCIRSEAWPCSACFHIAWAAAWKLAYKYRIPFIISGRQPEQMFRMPTRELFEGDDSLIAGNLSVYDRSKVKTRALRDIKNVHEVKEWLIKDKHLWDQAAEHLYVSLEEAKNSDFAPELLGFFLYEPYDIQKMISDLEEFTAWKAPDDRSMYGHADCSAHDGAGYLYYRNIGAPLLNLELSSSIRLGRISREEAVSLLEKEKSKLSGVPHESIGEISRMCKMSSLSIRSSPFRIHLKKKLRDIIKGRD